MTLKDLPLFSPFGPWSIEVYVTNATLLATKVGRQGYSASLLSANAFMQ